MAIRILKGTVQMKNFEDYIISGILEAYILGLTDEQETLEVEQMAEASAEIRKEMDLISENLERYIQANGVAPHPAIKPLLIATIDYTERLKNGEQPVIPPILHNGSKIADYADWLNRDDMVVPEDFKDIHAKIIGYTAQAVTAIVWLKDIAPYEVHHHEIEKFLIVEGACEITVEENVYSLVAGNFFSIPLHKNHVVKVNSDIPCKVIVQRVAA